MAKIEFLQEKVVRRPDGSGTKYEAGKCYELPGPSADHHTSRGIAKAASDKAKVSDPIEVDSQGRPVEEVAAESEKVAAREGTAGRTSQPFRTKIPDNWKALPEAQQISLAATLVPGGVRNKDEAVAAIEAELARRNKA